MICIHVKYKSAQSIAFQYLAIQLHEADKQYNKRATLRTVQVFYHFRYYYYLYIIMARHAIHCGNKKVIHTRKEQLIKHFKHKNYVSHVYNKHNEKYVCRLPKHLVRCLPQADILNKLAGVSHDCSQLLAYALYHHNKSVINQALNKYITEATNNPTQRGWSPSFT